MRIAYCPICEKAGLKYHDDKGNASYNRPLHGERWCPRCKQWVMPNRQKVETHARPNKPSRIRLR